MKALRTGTDADGIALRLRAMADEEEGETRSGWLLDAADIADEHAKLREALETADTELTRLFTQLPISGPLPSPSVMQLVKHALGR